MKQMKKLALNCSEMTISDAPEPAEVIIPLTGVDGRKDMDKLKLRLKEGTRLMTGQPLAPGIFSTVTGKVKGLEALLLANKSVTAVRIELADEEKIDPAVKADPEYSGKPSLDILERLNRANLGFRKELETVSTVVVSAVDTDPLHTVYHQLLREKKETVIEGLALVKQLVSAERVILAVPAPLYDLVSGAASDSIIIYNVNPLYPASLPELIIDSLSKVYNMDDHLFIGVEKVVAAVEALREGKPFAHKVITVIDENGSRNRRVRIGTPVKELLKETFLKDNDRVVIGGAFRGYACFDTGIPVTADMDSIYIQYSDKGEVSRDRNIQCMSCGKCVWVCPVNLDVNLICRYSEFSVFEKCHAMGVEACIECGLCAHYCPSGRSLVQYIRLAKKEKPAALVMEETDEDTKIENENGEKEQ